MASSGSKTFNLNVNDAIEEAFEQAQLKEPYTGRHYKSARRSLNILLTELINKGVNLWTMTLATISLTTGTASFTLSTSALDIIDAVVRDTTASSDTSMDRISIQEYLQRPRKSDPGKPIQYTVKKNDSGGASLFVWPVADATNYNLVGWITSYMDEVTSTGGAQTLQVPIHVMPAIVKGLAYYVALKWGSPDEAGLALRTELKGDYDALLGTALEEDRDRASLYVVPAGR